MKQWSSFLSTDREMRQTTTELRTVNLIREQAKLLLHNNISYTCNINKTTARIELQPIEEQMFTACSSNTSAGLDLLQVIEVAFVDDSTHLPVRCLYSFFRYTSLPVNSDSASERVHSVFRIPS
jgi:hypothetical protein